MAMMIQDADDYFRRLIPKRDSLLVQLEQQATVESIPIIGPVVGELLLILARISSARYILEMGTAIGYSTIYLAKGCEPNGGHVVTIEADATMAQRARANFLTAGIENQVEILNASAEDALKSLAGSYDLVFMDIDKVFYADALPHCHRLLKPGGMLIADNTAFEECRLFNEKLYHSDQWRSVQLYALLSGHSPEHDGLALAMRR